jgi:nitrite reductase/ring-hydroxylating ferredoxin subunit
MSQAHKTMIEARMGRETSGSYLICPILKQWICSIHSACIEAKEGTCTCSECSERAEMAMNTHRRGTGIDAHN